MLELTQTTEGHIFLTLVIGMCVFHTGNGIRLMIAQSGFGLGKPRRPDYPYTPSSLNMKNKLMHLCFDWSCCASYDVWFGSDV